MLEVGSTTVPAGLADRSGQKMCTGCQKARLRRECTLEHPKAPMDNAKLKCTPCHDKKVACSWKKVPPTLWPLKIAIVAGRDIVDIGMADLADLTEEPSSDSSSDLADRSYLLRLKAATEAALARVNVRIEQAMDDEIVQLTQAIDEVRFGGRTHSECLDRSSA